jgi:hypothetical protein
LEQSGGLERIGVVVQCGGCLFGYGLMQYLYGDTACAFKCSKSHARYNNMNKTRVEIGGIGILFRYKDSQIQENESGESYITNFICSGSRNDFIIDIELGNPPLYSRRHKLFEARENWRLFEDRKRYIFETFQSDIKEGNGINRVCFVEKGSSKGKVCILPATGSEADHKNWSLEQLMRILGHILIVSMIHRYQGVLIHSSSVILDGEGILFCGISAAGKTTLSKLWQKRAGVTVLSDDRVIVRKEGKEYFVYGTPWPGEGKMASSQKAPLKKIHFLFKDNQNTLIPLEKKEALGQIVTQCFPALWDRESIGFVMEFCGALLEDIPSFRFGFVPDESAVEFIENTFHHD